MEIDRPFPQWEIETRLGPLSKGPIDVIGAQKYSSFSVAQNQFSTNSVAKTQGQTLTIHRPPPWTIGQYVSIKSRAEIFLI